jgi:hypothetical protein
VPLGECLHCRAQLRGIRIDCGAKPEGRLQGGMKAIDA